MHRAKRSGGFTLIEAVISIIIVAVMVTAVMELMAAGTRANGQSQRRIEGQQLAIGLHDATLRWTAAQWQSANNRVYAPAINALGEPATDAAGWSQKLTVVPVNATNFQMPVPAGPLVSTYRVKGEVFYRDQRVCSLEWLVCF